MANAAAAWMAAANVRFIPFSKGGLIQTRRGEEHLTNLRNVPPLPFRERGQGVRVTGR